MKDRNMIISIIIGIITMLLLIGGATFAYFTTPITNTAGKTTISGQTQSIGTITLTNPTSNLYLSLSVADMALNKVGTYYATNTLDTSSVSNYNTKEVLYDIALATLSGGDESLKYTCTANINVALSGEMASLLKSGDAYLQFGGLLTNKVDLSTITSGGKYPVTINLDKDTLSQNLQASLSIVNSENDQTYLAGKNLGVEISNSDLECEVISEAEPEIVYDGSVDGYTVGYYMSANGPVTSSGNFYTSEFEVVPGETLYVVFDNERYSNYDFFEVFCNNAGAFIGYDANGNYTSMLKHADFQDVDLGNIQVRTIVVPENTTKLVANLGFAGVSGGENVAHSLKIYRDPVEFNTKYASVLNENNNLVNKNYVAFGDSITDGFNANYVSYAHYIATVNNMNFNSFAAGAYYANEILTKMEQKNSLLSSLSEDDYVIIAGFVNNATEKTTMGELSAEGTTEFDTTTYIGALEKIFYTYKIDKNYSAKIGVVLTPQPTGSNAHRDNPEYWEAAISVLEKYDIPYLNLYSESIDYVDGVHPSITGQMQMAALIEAWMNTL